MKKYSINTRKFVVHFTEGTPLIVWEKTPERAVIKAQSLRVSNDEAYTPVRVEDEFGGTWKIIRNLELLIQ